MKMLRKLMDSVAIEFRGPFMSRRKHVDTGTDWEELAGNEGLERDDLRRVGLIDLVSATALGIVVSDGGPDGVMDEHVQKT
jgi:hypothetical protein